VDQAGVAVNRETTQRTLATLARQQKTVVTRAARLMMTAALKTVTSAVPVMTPFQDAYVNAVAASGVSLL
jgi:hypothetical protein